LIQQCEATFGANFVISVRSSALSEDGETTSFAGQHNSLMHIGPDQLVDAIKNCLASAWSFGALSYRLLHQLPITTIQFAIVLQQMVVARKSGIAFSMHVQDNLADVVINCGYGMGEGIVSDRVTADFYQINRAYRSIH